VICALCAVRGAPGVSAWSVLLPAAWPAASGLGRVVLEADLDGGVAGARYGVGVEPGAPTLVADLRHVGDPSIPLETAGRILGDGAWLIPGPESAEAARRLWTADRAATSVASSLAADRERVWVCDLGRLTPASPTAPFLAAAAVTLVFCRDQPADLVQVPSRVALLQEFAAGEVAVVVVGSPSYERSELSEFFGCRRVWIVPRDDDIVELSRQVWTNRKARRSGTWRAAVELASGLATPAGLREEVSEA